MKINRPSVYVVKSSRNMLRIMAHSLFFLVIKLCQICLGNIFRLNIVSLIVLLWWMAFFDSPSLVFHSLLMSLTMLFMFVGTVFGCFLNSASALESLFSSYVVVPNIYAIQQDSPHRFRAIGSRYSITSSWKKAAVYIWNHGLLGTNKDSRVCWIWCCLFNLFLATWIWMVL